MNAKQLISPAPLTRRAFLNRSSLAAAGALLADRALQSAEATNPPGARYHAAVIGHTGHGDYGHGLDVVFNDRENVQVVAVADPEAAGRSQAAARCKALRQYADYREMLEMERPQLVSVAPRWTDQHHAMASAAFKAGAHVYMEKPFTPTLAQADALLAIADQGGLRIAVAHQMRLAPGILQLKRELDDGLIGDLLEIRAWGKQDSRAGGEDMLVLGTHLFDLIRFFAGDAQWCTARVLQNGRDLTRADAREVQEKIGPVAGDEIEAQFAFAKGIHASFTSRARLRDATGHWGIELAGSKSAARILSDIDPAIHVLKRGTWEPSGRTDHWQRLESDPALKGTAAERGSAAANRRVVNDWLDAIRTKREPVCSGRAAMKALEMVMAVYHAALSGARVTLPLKDREHPLRA